MSDNERAEARIKKIAEPIIAQYRSGAIDFEVFIKALQGIDDASIYEQEAAKETVG